MSAAGQEAGALQELAAGSFIWQQEGALSAARCRDIIERFEAHPGKGPGARARMRPSGRT